MEQTQQTPQGKGLGIAGFVISVIALVLWLFISAAAVLAAALGGGMGLAGFWLIFSLTGLVLSILGMMKLSKTGGKKGLAIAGLVIGLLATGLSASTVFGVMKAHEEMEKAGLGNGVMDAFTNELEKGLDSLDAEINKSLDSLSNASKE